MLTSDEWHHGNFDRALLEVQKNLVLISNFDFRFSEMIFETVDVPIRKLCFMNSQFHYCYSLYAMLCIN